MSLSSEAVKRWRVNSKKKIVAALGGKCRVCGYDKCHQALQVHHVDPSKKEFSFGAFRASPKSWEKAVVELKKCVLLCGNCHAEVHDGILDISYLELIFIQCIPSDRAR
jgi:predicted HNH restriction endonuclease